MGLLKTKNKYYDLTNILKLDAEYNMIIGERSNGKTYALLKYILEQYVKYGTQGAYLRRWDEDFKGKRGSVIFDGLVSNNEVAKITKGEWTGVYYWSSRWYLSRIDENGKRETSDEPFCYGFSISNMEHDKSTSYPNVTTIVFDEFISRNAYLPDEFVKFMNVLSTIIRDRNNVKIFMLANTVNKYGCPYFVEMGLRNIDKMKKGTIQEYMYGASTLKVAVEYCDTLNKSKESNKYFAFDNPKLRMITEGSWELTLSPHLPYKYEPRDILFTFFIVYDEKIMQCEIINKCNDIFMYVHLKTSELKNLDDDLIYTTSWSERPNFRRNILKPFTSLEKKIKALFDMDKVFYQDNEIGELMRNYINWCKQTRGINLE